MTGSYAAKAHQDLIAAQKALADEQEMCVELTRDNRVLMDERDAERAHADRLAEALALTMPFVRVYGPEQSVPKERGEAILAEHDKRRSEV